MTPPDLTQPQRLDLEEGKRLLSEKQRLEGDANALALGDADGVLEAAAAYAHAAFMVWLQDNADSLIAGAEEAKKLRALLFAVDKAYGEGYALPAFVVEVARLLTAPFDAALTPPEPLSAQQETP